MTAITPFSIAVSDEAIADLHERLAMTRWPTQVGADFERGQPVGFIRGLAADWAQFDWRAAEARLNRLPQFTTEIDGQTIHFVHVKSARPNALPLILTHGWPATFTEYLPLIELLTNPPDSGAAYDVVLPSLPGFGFSPLSGPGWDSKRIARAWHTLMQRLGYSRYGAAGNDVGSFVTKELGVLAPEGLVGIHMQQVFSFPSDPEAWTKLDEFEQAGFANVEGWEKNNGYQRIQQSRPGTLGFSLADSPSGLLAWVAELPFGFDGNQVGRYDRTHFLTDMSIYWFTDTGGSAANVYLEDNATSGGADENRVDLPVGVAVFPDDFRSVRAHASVNNNIVHWTQMPRGGHFAAVNEPELLAADLRAFFSQLG